MCIVACLWNFLEKDLTWQTQIENAGMKNMHKRALSGPSLQTIG